MTMSDREKEIYKIVIQLNDNEIKEILKYIEFLKQKKAHDNKNS